MSRVSSHSRHRRPKSPAWTRSSGLAGRTAHPHGGGLFQPYGLHPASSGQLGPDPLLQGRHQWGAVHQLQAGPGDLLPGRRDAGTAPEHTLVLEDSYNGVRAGPPAVFVTVMVPDLAAGRRDAPPVHRRVRQPARGAPDAGGRPAVRVSSFTTAGTMPRRIRPVTNRFSTPASFPRRVMVRLRDRPPIRSRRSCGGMRPGRQQKIQPHKLRRTASGKETCPDWRS